MRSIPVAVLASITLPLAFALPPSTAAAHDWCVAKPRCAGSSIAASQLQAQLTVAESNREPDRFFLGSTVFARGPYSYSSDEPVELHGSRGGNGAITTLQAAVAGRAVLTLRGAAASIDGVRFEIALNASTALDLRDGIARDISIVQLLGTSAGAGAILGSGATLADASVVTSGSAPAVGVIAGSATITRSLLQAGDAAAVMIGESSTATTVTHSTLNAPFGLYALGGTVAISDSVVDGRGGSTSAAFLALSQNGAPVSVDAARTTAIGSGATVNSIGAYASATGGTASVTVRDSAIADVGSPSLRYADPGSSASLTLDRVAHADPIGNGDSGAGTTTETNRLPAPTGFVDPADSNFRLLPGSPLIDAGDPAYTAAADATDRGGDPRLRDGNGDCGARLDVGAYEYQPAGPCTPPTTPPIDQPGPGAGPGPGPGTPQQQQPPTRAAPDRTAPRLSALRMPARLTPGTALPRLRAARRAPAIAFTLSERASVTLTFKRRGRDGRFRAVRGGSLSVRAAAGANRLRFAGRVTRRARLAPGRYRVTLTAVDAAGNRSRGASARFRLG